jgi:hypothetical protein
MVFIDLHPEKQKPSFGRRALPLWIHCLTSDGVVSSARKKTLKSYLKIDGEPRIKNPRTTE